MYQMLEFARPSADLGCWESLTGEFASVVGYTSFGDFFLRSPRTDEYAILTTIDPDIVALGYNDLPSFKTFFLNNEEIVRDVIRPDDIIYLQSRLGSLLADEIFYPVPYPCLGGSGNLDTYQKGNVWAFAGLIGQAHGVADLRQ